MKIDKDQAHDTLDVLLNLVGKGSLNPRVVELLFRRDALMLLNQRQDLMELATILNVNVADYPVYDIDNLSASNVSLEVLNTYNLVLKEDLKEKLRSILSQVSEHPDGREFLFDLLKWGYAK